jgi:hypothetical protein
MDHLIGVAIGVIVVPLWMIQAELGKIEIHLQRIKHELINKP